MQAKLVKTARWAFVVNLKLIQIHRAAEPKQSTLTPAQLIVAPRHTSFTPQNFSTRYTTFPPSKISAIVRTLIQTRQSSFY